MTTLTFTEKRFRGYAKPQTLPKEEWTLNRSSTQTDILIVRGVTWTNQKARYICCISITFSYFKTYIHFYCYRTLSK